MPILDCDYALGDFVYLLASDGAPEIGARVIALKYDGQFWYKLQWIVNSEIREHWFQNGLFVRAENQTEEAYDKLKPNESIG